jgi:glucokinase
VFADLLSCGFMPAYSIGVDLGGTNLRAAAISITGQVIEKIAGSTNLQAGRKAVLEDIAGAIRSLGRECGTRGLAGVGIGVPGFIRMAEGVIANCNNLPQLEGVPIRDEIERRLGTRVVLENDANAAALGEKWMGAGKDVDDLVLLTLGTGVGGGIISGGRVLHGFVGMAGEIGHIMVVPNGNPCGCGNHGCLEKHASATAVEGMAYMMGLGEGLTSKDVFDMAEAGNENARRIFRRMGVALGVALATLVNLFNFPLYLLSGGMLPAWNYFAPAMMEEVRFRSFTFRNTSTRIEQAILGNEAGLYGAAYLPFQAAGAGRGTA